VRDNIAGFGGDVSRITLFGQSAGSASVDIYSYAWTADPIVNAFIEESGSVGVLTGGDVQATEKWYNVSMALGCGGPEAAATSEACVRTKNISDIVTALSTVPAGFVPVVDNVTIFADYAARGSAGQFVKKPLLVGSNNNEAGLFDAAAGGTFPPAAITAMNAEFTCPAGDAARYRAMNGVPVWRYRYFGVWPNLNISANAGAFHSAEVSQIFGNTVELMGIPNTANETAVSTLFRSAWTSFAKRPETALDALGWPRYVVAGTSLIEIAFDDQTRPIFVNSTMYDNVCQNLNQSALPPV